MRHTFTTEAIDVGKRVDFWQKFVCDHIANVDCRVEDNRHFAGEIKSFPLSQIELSLIKACPHEVFRRENRIDAVRDHYFVFLYQKSGTAEYQQHQQISNLAPGDCVLYDPKQPYHMKLLEPFEHLTMRVPRFFLTEIEPHLPLIWGNKISVDTPGGQFISQYLDNLILNIDNLEATALQSYTEIAVKLTIEGFKHTLCDQIKIPQAHKSTLLAQAKLYMLKNVGDYDLSIPKVAAHVGISSRHLGRLFQEEDTSAGRWLKGIRLERSASMLTHPEHFKKTISEIAYAMGFSDVSHFCKEFRKRFQHSPTEHRKMFSSEA